MSIEFDCDLYFISITQTNELSVSLGSAFCAFFSDCVFLMGLWALFMGPATWEKYKFNVKTGSHNTILTFKNYFITVFSVFSF